VRYATGRGVARDDTEAVRWFRRAADRGYSEGQFNLSQAYAGGRGVEKDAAEAIRWLKLAADQNHPRALGLLASAYMYGNGVNVDLQEARRLAEKAAASGLPAPQLQLASMMESGRGGSQDRPGAMRLYRLAAAQGFAPAQAELGYVYATGRLGAADRVRAYVWLAVANQVFQDPTVANSRACHNEADAGAARAPRRRSHAWRASSGSVESRASKDAYGCTRDDRIVLVAGGEAPLLLIAGQVKVNLCCTRVLPRRTPHT
jgi:TPR repeat protein